MASDAVKTRRFVFRDCKQKPLAYLAVTKAAGFSRDIVQGRLIVNVELHPKKVLGGPRGSRARRGGSRGR